MSRLKSLLAALVVLFAPQSLAATAPNYRPVKTVAAQRLTVTTQAGSGQLALDVSADWSHPEPGITRALIIIHGYLRNGPHYFRIGEETVAAGGPSAAGTLVIAPQFLADIDTKAHHLPPEIMRWTTGGWEGGANALGPAPISSFAALDTIIARLADRTLFPNLHEVIFAGHSGGAQVVQRYAILAPDPPASVLVRYVVANPSSYAYFDAWRPVAQAACARENDWKYGMNRLPTYAGSATAATLEARYATRPVTYLLGTNDTDPYHPALDRSCMGEAQGPYRLARGLAYALHLRASDPAARHQPLYLVQGVGHDARGMFSSACGLTALFDKPGCAPIAP